MTPGDVVLLRREVADEPLLGESAYDYADAFAVRVSEPDTRSAEEWARTGLEGAPPALRRLVLFAHRRVLRFRLGSGSEQSTILGWTVLVSEPDVVMLEATGPLVRGVIVGRRREPTTAELTTFVDYRAPAARVVWTVVAPLHRRVARYLIRRAALSR